MPIFLLFIKRDWFFIWACLVSLEKCYLYVTFAYPLHVSKNVLFLLKWIVLPKEYLNSLSLSLSHTKTHTATPTPPCLPVLMPLPLSPFSITYPAGFQSWFYILCFLHFCWPDFLHIFVKNCWKARYILHSGYNTSPHNDLFLANGKGGFRSLGCQHNLSYIYVYIHWNRVEYFPRSHYYLLNSKAVRQNVWCLDTIGLLVDCLLYV